MRKISMALLLMVLVLGQYFYNKYGIDYKYVLDFIHQHEVFSPLLFIVIYALLVVLLVPTLPLNLGAGILFGICWGGLLSVIGTTLGAVIAFGLSRCLFSDFIRGKVNNHTVQWIEQKVQINPWKIIAFVRLCAALPTGPVNYMLGLTEMKYTAYTFGTFIFLILPCLITSAIGQHIGSAIFENQANNSLLWNVMMIFTGLSIIMFAIPMAGRKLYNMEIK